MKNDRELTNVFLRKIGLFWAKAHFSKSMWIWSKNKFHSTDAQKTIDSCLSEISRVIKSKNGRFLSLTFAQPHFRTPFISKPKYSWGVEYQTFGTGFHYFCYVMTKGWSQLQDQVTVSSAVDISIGLIFFDSLVWSEKITLWIKVKSVGGA